MQTLNNKHITITVSVAITVLIAICSGVWFVATKLSAIENDIAMVAYKIEQVNRITPVVMDNQKDLIALKTLHNMD